MLFILPPIYLQIIEFYSVCKRFPLFTSIKKCLGGSFNSKDARNFRPIYGIRSQKMSNKGCYNVTTFQHQGHLLYFGIIMASDIYLPSSMNSKTPTSCLSPNFHESWISPPSTFQQNVAMMLAVPKRSSTSIFIY